MNFLPESNLILSLNSISVPVEENFLPLVITIFCFNSILPVVESSVISPELVVNVTFPVPVDINPTFPLDVDVIPPDPDSNLSNPLPVVFTVRFWFSSVVNVIVPESSCNICLPFTYKELGPKYKSLIVLVAEPISYVSSVSGIILPLSVKLLIEFTSKLLRLASFALISPVVLTLPLLIVFTIVSAVIEPPRAVDTPAIVIELFDNLAFVILPASILFVTPVALTLKVSEFISKEESSTWTAKLTELPNETVPPPDNPSPAVTVIELFVSWELVIVLVKLSVLISTTLKLASFALISPISSKLDENSVPFWYNFPVK